MSFGSLDPLLFRRSTAPFRLPDLDLAVLDGRASIAGAHGAVGVALTGGGDLRDGFSGIAALVAPALNAARCRGAARFAGRLAMHGEQARVIGPLDITAFVCRDRGLALATGRLAVMARIDRGFDGGEAAMAAATGEITVGGIDAVALNGGARLRMHRGAVAGDVAVTAHDVGAGQGPLMHSVSVTGALRATAGLARVAADGSFTARGPAGGQALAGGSAAAQRASAGTPVAPLLAEAGAAVAREWPGSRLAGSFALRGEPGMLSLLVPQARFTGASGASLAALSRVGWRSGGGAGALSGNFTTGGPGLPVITGRITGASAMQLVMAPYRARDRGVDAALAIPALTVVRDARGSAWAGAAVLSGPIGSGADAGAVRDLVLPLEGRWEGTRLEAWHGCLPVRFGALRLSGVAVTQATVKLCSQGRAGLVADAHGARIALSTSALDLGGRAERRFGEDYQRGGRAALPRRFGRAGIAVRRG